MLLLLLRRSGAAAARHFRNALFETAEPIRHARINRRLAEYR